MENEVGVSGSPECDRGPGAFQGPTYSISLGPCDLQKPMENEGGVSGSLKCDGGPGASQGPTYSTSLGHSDREKPYGKRRWSKRANFSS